MDLWVKSQGGGILIKAKDIEVFSITNTIKGDIICNYKNDDDYWVLGTYKSNERALEVINEIQNHIDNRYNYIYEMPEE